MATVNMDSVDFYRPPTKAGSASDMRHKASNFRVPTVLDVGKNSTTVRSSNISRLQKYDLIEFLDMGVTSLNKSLNQICTPAPELDDTEANTESMSNGFNATHGENRNNSKEDDDLPTLEELLRSAEETQKLQQLHSSGAQMTGGFEGSFRHGIKNNCYEAASPRSRVGENKEKPITLGKDHSENRSIHICDGLMSEEQVWDLPRRKPKTMSPPLKVHQTI